MIDVVLAEILVLAGGAILPASAVLASTRTFSSLKRVQEHSSPVNGVPLPAPLASQVALSGDDAMFPPRITKTLLGSPPGTLLKTNQ